MGDPTYEFDLLKAAVAGNVELVRSMGPNRVDNDGWSPLMTLISMAKLPMIDGDTGDVTWLKLDENMVRRGVVSLLAAGADVRFRDSGITALSLAQDKGFQTVIPLLVEAERDQADKPMPTPPSSGGCVIATACLGADSDEIAALRKLRDDAILADPIARDFFHVFWSRYYEWSPGVARIASQDGAVRESIRWSFLDPWLAWMEFATLVGRRDVSALTDVEKDEILLRLNRRLTAWLDELPNHLESKCPSDKAEVFEAFDRFRMSALKVFGK
ncbi:MAG TPA: hypothetical protein PK329_08980 [Myxococcota bacterium]|jgi:hypothetical protein|nr:hypothetical protein [Myxococcota bacterium]HOE83077.1 hypothetical protein [Myxococcota bacterium]HON25523.1 hypothetical protein [Myxococcota bacterium]HOS62554.1 hypothetical protein [Myxococcota bacterium]HPC92308.1 hypothetical protein [Myxococcota bacterium]